MEKRQSILVAVAGLFILAVAGFWWFTQNAEEAPVEPVATTTAPIMHATVSEPLPAAPPAPVIAAAAVPESDVVALSEEAVDKALAEKNELASRAGELEAQVSDGQALIALKEKQIRELEARLGKAPAQTMASKKPAGTTP